MLHTTAGYLFYSVAALVIYLFSAYCLREMARKQAFSRPWFAWVPVLDVYLLCRVAGRGIVWTILVMLPFIDFIFLAIIFMRLSRRLHHNRFYGLLLLVPIIQFIVLWDLAFGLRHSWEAVAAGN